MSFSRLGWGLVLGVAAVGSWSCGKDEGGGGGGGGSNPCAAVPTETVQGLEFLKPDLEPAACREVPVAGDPEATQCEKKPAPDWSCLEQPRPLGAPASVTMRGCVETFGIGDVSYDLTVAVMREAVNGVPVDPGYDVAGPAGQQDEHTAGALFGQRVLSEKVAETVCADEGRFEVAGVDTETRLIVRVTQQNEDASRRSYVDTYQYNVVLRNASIVDAAGMPVADPSGCTPASCFVDENINTITIPTFKTIPRAAGVSVITGESDLFDGEGQGHIAGEVQDCTSLDTVQNAIVSIDGRARKLAYFNVDFPPERDNLADPKPEATRSRTNADGLYAAIGVDTQRGGTPVKVGALALQSRCGADGVCMCTDDGQPNPMWTAADAGEGDVRVLGVRTVYVFPDSITVLTFDRTMYETN